MVKNKVSLKKNNSSMQVIKTLKVIMDGDYSMSELITRLNQGEPAAVFNNSVISKYINTCRLCGIEISKLNNKYYVTRMPFGMEISDDNAELLREMFSFVKNEMPQKTFNLFNKLYLKLIRHADKKISLVAKDYERMSFEKFELAVKNKNKIRLFFKNRAETDCVPISIEHIGKKTFFKVYNKKTRFIDISRLSGFKIIPEKFIKEYDDAPSVVFRLYGDLAKRYTLREHERLLDSDVKDSITVSNSGEPKEELLSRLMRYDNMCEILMPTSYREEIKMMIQNTLNNYGV